MPQPIGRYPSGLLGLLNSKSRGTTPAYAEDFVRLVSDISPYYLNNFRRIVTGFTSAINLGGSWGAAGVGPGRGQIAYVWNCTALRAAALAAGTTYRLAMQYNAIDEAQPVVISPNETFTTGEFVNLGGPQGFWLPQNSQLGVRAASVALGTAVGLTVTADISIIDL